jgi:hypothetical protein
MAVIPVLADAAQHGGSVQRVQALLVLHRLGRSNVTWGMGTLPNLEAVLPEVQAAFQGLASAAQPSALERTDEEKALTAALAKGRQRPREFGRHRQGEDERAPVTTEYMATVREVIGLGASVRRRNKGCAVTLFAHWSGGAEKLALLEQLGDVQHLCIKSPTVDAMLPYLQKLTHLEALGLDDASQLSDARVAELKQALPKTEFLCCLRGEPGADMFVVHALPIGTTVLLGAAGGWKFAEPE